MTRIQQTKLTWLKSLKPKEYFSIEVQIHWCAQQLLIPKKIKTCALISNSFPLPSIILDPFIIILMFLCINGWEPSFCAFCAFLRADLNHTHTDHIVWTCNYFLWMFCECAETKHEHFQPNCNFFSGPLKHPSSESREC